MLIILQILSLISKYICYSFGVLKHFKLDIKYFWNVRQSDVWPDSSKSRIPIVY